MEKADTLVELLRRMNSGQDVEGAKQEARDLLSEMSAEELSRAEERLDEENISPEDMESLCEVHMKMSEEQKEDMDVPPGHMVHTLVSEHDHILGFLDELEEVNEKIQRMDEYRPGRDEFARLRNVAAHLVDSEPHHDREEEVLFPELEERGVTGPPNVMRMEHEQLRPQKHRLEDLAETVGEMDFSEFKRQLETAVEFIVPTLRDHIYKENNILYPTAVRLIDDDELWEKMRHDADEVGYCCFTPSAEGEDSGHSETTDQ